MDTVKIANDLKAAASAQQAHTAALLEYQAALIAGEWQNAEKIRLRVVAAGEAYLDNLAAAYRRMRSG